MYQWFRFGLFFVTAAFATFCVLSLGVEDVRWFMLLNSELS